VYAKKNLDHLKTMNTQASSGMKAFWDFDRAAFEEGALSAKAKQIIAVAVALTTQCPYCIDIHGAAARKAGATDAELTEAALVAAAIRAGGAITHATHLWTGDAPPK
jgi:AhpD family alkylhydroperoxidase